MLETLCVCYCMHDGEDACQNMLHNAAASLEAMRANDDGLLLLFSLVEEVYAIGIHVLESMWTL
jgi:hypothetical protein